MKDQEFFAQHENGIKLEVQLAPKSKQNRIISVHDNRLKISVTSAPVDGKANKQLIAFLAERLGCSKSSIELLKGMTNRKKTLLIKDIKPERVLALLD